MGGSPPGVFTELWGRPAERTAQNLDFIGRINPSLKHPLDTSPPTAHTPPHTFTQATRMDALDLAAQPNPIPPYPQKGIGRISYSHEALINWLLLNPDRPLREAAMYFGYTQAWLSTIIHSDLFQAKLHLRQNAVFAQVAADIPTMLGAASRIALATLTEKLEECQDPKFLLDASDKLLHRMGYAPAAARNPIAAPVVNNTQINNFSVSAADLEQAREMAKQASASARIPELPSTPSE